MRIIRVYINTAENASPIFAYTPATISGIKQKAKFRLLSSAALDKNSICNVKYISALYKYILTVR